MSAGEARRTKRYVVEASKWLIAAGLIFALVKSGRLSLEDLRGFVSRPGFFMFCFLVNYAMLIAGFLRWKTLVGALGVKIPTWDAIRLGMVGQFFSAVIPGTISGDLVKAVFVARRYPDRRLYTVASVLLDRILGLSALLWVGALGFLLGRPALLELTHPKAHVLRSLGWALVLLSSLVVLGLAFFPQLRAVVNRLQPARLQNWRLVRTLNAILDGYASNPGVLWRMTLLSVLFHAVSVFVLYQIATAAFGPGPWGSVDIPVFAMISVMGLCAMALPIAPMGLGVGQLAFATMFSIAGAPSATFGASIITASQILNLFVNLSGGLFYLTYRHETVLQEPDAV